LLKVDEFPVFVVQQTTMACLNFVVFSMRIVFVIIIIASLIGLSFVSKTKTGIKNKEVKSVSGTYTPVALLELFTSEGCSSCPPADRLLPELAKLDSNIIPLSFHVDYWNRLGWEDPFSKSEYSDRQRTYADQFHLESVYTPQLVVNGEYELVGSNRTGAQSAIKKALLEQAAVQINITDVKMIDGLLQMTVESNGDLKKTDLLAALVQQHAVVGVGAGENSGAKLSHINVVISLTKQKAEQKTVFKMTRPRDFDFDIDGEGWKLIVFAQQQTGLKITGAVLYNPK
jgi:hypothetical protein